MSAPLSLQPAGWVQPSAEARVAVLRRYRRLREAGGLLADPLNAMTVVAGGHARSIALAAAAGVVPMPADVQPFVAAEAYRVEIERRVAAWLFGVYRPVRDRAPRAQFWATGDLAARRPAATQAVTNGASS